MDSKEKQQMYDALMSQEDHYKVEAQWHGWAGNFHRYRCQLIGDVLRGIGFDAETGVLDIGSGPSLLGEIFSPEESPRITAIDISEVNVTKGRERYPHITFAIDDAQTPHLEGQWDIVFAGEIIEHLESPQQALENWTALLKPGGTLVITTPNSLVSPRTKEHISLLKTWQLKRMLEALNYEKIDIIGIDLFVPMLGRIGRVIQRWPKLSDAIFQTTMRIPYHSPNFARDIMYVYRKM
jgi:2-polyprenyl-3-methyl-5-hydroxy-6-metoxy-1,4-benzoquinol methylase